MNIIHKLEMDMVDRGIVQRIDVVQGDCNTREIELTLLSGREAWAVPEGAAVRMRYCKSDGTKGIYDTMPDGTAAWSVEENKVTVRLAPQMLTVPGLVVAQVVLVQDTAELATFAVQIRVERNPAADVMESEDYVNMLQWMEGELEQLLEQAKASGEFQGDPGPTPYAYAVEAGYTEDEVSFQKMLITPCLPLTGGTMTGTVNMGGQALKGLGSPAANEDAATKGYVDKKRLQAFVTLTADGWGDAAPYVQSVNVSGLLSGDWPRIEADYTGNIDSDRALKMAMDCVDYVVPYHGILRVFCLEDKPEIDMDLHVEILR